MGVEARLHMEAAQAQPEEVVSTTAPQHLEAPIPVKPTVAGQEPTSIALALGTFAKEVEVYT